MSGPALMPPPIQFRDLGTVIDELHDLFERWEQGQALPLDDFSLQVMKLSVHEWVANLVQHADFGAQRPLIQVTIQPDGEQVHCAIEDNSKGFDFGYQIVEQQQALGAAVPRDRGRGLLIMIACTEGLRYHQPVAPTQDATASPDYGKRHRLEFSISASRKPWLDIPF